MEMNLGSQRFWQVPCLCQPRCNSHQCCSYREYGVQECHRSSSSATRQSDVASGVDIHYQATWTYARELYWYWKRLDFKRVRKLQRGAIGFGSDAGKICCIQEDCMLNNGSIWPDIEDVRLTTVGDQLSLQVSRIEIHMDYGDCIIFVSKVNTSAAATLLPTTERMVPNDDHLPIRNLLWWPPLNFLNS